MVEFTFGDREEPPGKGLKCAMVQLVLERAAAIARGNVELC